MPARSQAIPEPLWLLFVPCSVQTLTGDHCEPRWTSTRLGTLPRHTCPAAGQVQQRPTSPRRTSWLAQLHRSTDIEGQTLSWWLKHQPQCFGYAVLLSGRCVSPAACWCGVIRCTKSTGFSKTMTWALSAALISSRLSLGSAWCILTTCFDPSRPWELSPHSVSSATPPVGCPGHWSSTQGTSDILVGYRWSHVQGEKKETITCSEDCTGFMISKILLFFLLVCRPFSISSLLPRVETGCPLCWQHDAMELAAFLFHSPTLNAGQAGWGKQIWKGRRLCCSSFPSTLSCLLFSSGLLPCYKCR